ncbi:MAG: hypothetical protein ACO1G9_04725 [Bacteroidota bacterium]
MKRYIYTAIMFLSISGIAIAKENVNSPQRSSGPTGGNQTFAGCEPSKSRADLNINNVRTPIWINGDMWWDLTGNALYEVPVGSGKHSLFAGAIWIGGLEAGSGNLKVAAQTYRQSGSDFWPGPIDSASISVTPENCLKYDKHWNLTFAEVKNFHLEYHINGNLSYPVPQNVKDWPGNGFNQNFVLAPFYDADGDGLYLYENGDYPKYNIDGNFDNCDKSLLKGDQTIWWVFNDVGNIHNETNSQFPVGVEIQAQAFGFNTGDEINNMTFYRYKIINRATTDLNETYFGAWVDPDLGNYLDDYVGCDVERGLGFCYNGDAVDDGALGYGANPPAIGVDFFEGPLADSGDGKDNDRDSIIDEVGEQIIMSKFVYYNNDFSNFGNPENAQQYYDYLRGIWKDGSPMLYGGNGYQSGGVPCDFMFPGTSDPYWLGTDSVPQFIWTETTPNGPNSTPNTPDDRRFLQSAGPFTLKPGNVNYITTGAVWARTSSGGPDASVRLLKLADAKAQNLFESCFKVINGPSAPDITIREMDKELILSISNLPGSNNLKEDYIEKDINIPAVPSAIFRFEGYKVFQVIDPSVSVNDLKNADKARLIFQCDIKNGIAQIVNKVFDGNISAFVPTEEVFGEDKGLRHSFKVTTDAFATGNPSLVNHKTYYFYAVAYAFDPVADVQNPLDPDLNGIYGQPYVQSRQNARGEKIEIFTGIPHISTPEEGGLVLAAEYGDGPEITRYTGFGNGHLTGTERGTLDIKQSQIDEIIFNQSNNRIQTPTYVGGHGPVDIRVYDPFAIDGGDFELWLTDTITKVVFTGDIQGNASVIDSVSNVDGLKIGLYLNAGNDFFPQNSKIIAINGTGPYQVVMSGPITTSGPIDNLEITASARWILKNVQSGEETVSLKSLEFPYDQLFPNQGFSISMSQVKNTGEAKNDGNGFVEATLVYANPNNRWLSGIQDVNNFEPFNWIMAGKDVDPDYLPEIDPNEFYSKSLGGSWAPFRLVNSKTAEDRVTPAPSALVYGNPSAPKYDNLQYLSNVDVVITSDKSKWSRCVVFEMGSNSLNTEGGQYHGLIRKHPSMNLDGTYSSTDSGYSYFPGYAIDLETGERLNIAFGEDSRFPSENGADMKWNPNSNLGYFDNTGTFNLQAGGKHYIYVFGNKSSYSDTIAASSANLITGPIYPSDTSYWGPAYDQCNHIRAALWNLPNVTSTANKKLVKKIWKDCMWVGTPMLTPGQTLLDNQVKIRLRVAKPYRQYVSGVSGSINDNFPFYRFSTESLKPKVQQTEVATNALGLINVVPNPYYAYSSYEVNQIDNRVKIVNLPAECVISIYTPGGALVRKFNRSVGKNNSAGASYPETNLDSSIDWDLKNSKGVPIASGMYIVHIAAEGIGERTIKWFGVIRPIDLDTF